MWTWTLGPPKYEVWCNKWIIAVANKMVWYSFGCLASMVEFFQACASQICSSDKGQKRELLSWQKRNVDLETMHISSWLYHWYWILLSSCKLNTGNSSSHTHSLSLTQTHTSQCFLSPFYCIQIVVLCSTSRHAETLNGNHSVPFVWFPRMMLPVQVVIVKLHTLCIYPFMCTDMWLECMFVDIRCLQAPLMH